jgi:membrane peptidoglycan carboxypeptidase
MVGSRDYHYPDFGNFNATLSLRQPGSSIKVVTYATSFKKGFSPGNTVLDAPVNFKDEWGNSYAPVNYDGSFHGPVSIRTALGSSLNIPAVKMLATVGVDSMVQTARDMGITTFTDPKNYGLALTLGGAEVRMIDMMSVYGTLSQTGRLNRPNPILKVTDSDGNVLEEYSDLSKQAIDPEVAFLLTSILSDNSARTPAFGPNSLLNVSPNVAVKTGTSDNKKDNWTFGYSKDFVVGVWVGNNDSSPMNPVLTSGVTGAAPIWNKITRVLLSKYPASQFQKPAGIAEVIIDGRRDLAIAGNLPKALVRVRQEPDKITFSDGFSFYATPSAQAANPVQPSL